MPQYVGVNLLVEGFKIRCPCPLPSLRSSNRSAQKHSGPVKEKEPAEKVKPLPERLSNSAETQLKNTSSGVPSLPPLPPERSVPVPVESATLHLPMTVKIIHLPVDTQSHPALLWKRRPEVSNVCSEKVQPRPTEKHLCLWRSPVLNSQADKQPQAP